jgi:hypothetical protein
MPLTQTKHRGLLRPQPTACAQPALAARARRAKHLPGPGQYRTAPGIGRQTLSDKKTLPSVGFSRGTREALTKKARLWSGLESRPPARGPRGYTAAAQGVLGLWFAALARRHGVAFWQQGPDGWPPPPTLPPRLA